MNCCIEGRKPTKEVCCYIILKNYLSVCSDLFCTANNQQIHGIMRDTQEITKLELHMNWENPHFWGDDAKVLPESPGGHVRIHAFG
jgi:hypothetical protein